MKLIKRFLMALFSAVICAGLWSAVAYADETEPEILNDPVEGEIPINETTFPDEYFRNLVSNSFDTDHSTTLSEDERAQVEVIYCNRSSIANLTGIEHFPNLSQIMCQENQLTSQEGTNYGLMASAVTLVVVPLVIVYIFLQKYIIKGMTAGAIKG